MEINLNPILKKYLSIPSSSAKQKKIIKILQWGDNQLSKEFIYLELKNSVAKTKRIILDKFRTDAENLLDNLNSGDKKMCLKKLDEAIAIEEIRRKGVNSKKIKRITKQITAKKLKDNPRAARIFNELIKKLVEEINPLCLSKLDRLMKKPRLKDTTFKIIAEILNAVNASGFTLQRVRQRYHKHCAK